jgi:hypothetical protein
MHACTHKRIHSVRHKRRIYSCRHLGCAHVYVCCGKLRNRIYTKQENVILQANCVVYVPLVLRPKPESVKENLLPNQTLDLKLNAKFPAGWKQCERHARSSVSYMSARFRLIVCTVEKHHAVLCSGLSTPSYAPHVITRQNMAQRGWLLANVAGNTSNGERELPIKKENPTKVVKSAEM